MNHLKGLPGKQAWVINHLYQIQRVYTEWNESRMRHEIWAIGTRGLVLGIEVKSIGAIYKTKKEALPDYKKLIRLRKTNLKHQYDEAVKELNNTRS